MRNKVYKLIAEFLTASMLTGIIGPLPVRAAVDNGWEVVDGSSYWYENGIRQGTEERGKEIYDPQSDAWYWLDAVDNGKKAVSKDVYQESAGGNWADRGDGTGKWVRYDADGHMIKGWSINEQGTYYFDPIYGTMAKGVVTIENKAYEFDTTTGVLLKEIEDNSGGQDADNNVNNDNIDNDNDNTDSDNTDNDTAEDNKGDNKENVEQHQYSDAVVEELLEYTQYKVEKGENAEGVLVLT